MIPKLVITSNIEEQVPLVYLVVDGKIPSDAGLTDDESTWVGSRLKSKQRRATVNSYKRHLYFISIDPDRSETDRLEDLRKGASALKGEIGSNKSPMLGIVTSTGRWKDIAAFTEGLLLSAYSFDKYKTSATDKKEDLFPETIFLRGEWSDHDLNTLRSSCEAVFFTRNLVNEPVSYLTAEVLADEIVAEGQRAGFSVDVFNKGKIESLKMGGLLAVNRGSVDPPVFCVLEWKPEKPVNNQPVVLVGKGVTYDTGGLNLKPGDYMDQMKTDMAGGAAVAGVLSFISRVGLPVHVIGLIPSTDNRPGGNAFVQGDVITMYNGMTVEIVNTDAEGRLILADALAYSRKYNPALVIDIATLTGSAQMTFGKEAIAAMGNASDEIFNLLTRAGEEKYERISRLPFWAEYAKYIESSIADIKNLGKREAGAITAGKFLERFAPKPYIHLDIAGTAAPKEDDHYRLKDASGSGVRLLSEFLCRIAAGEFNLNA